MKRPKKFLLSIGAAVALTLVNPIFYRGTSQGLIDENSYAFENIAGFNSRNLFNNNLESRIKKEIFGVSKTPGLSLADIGCNMSEDELISKSQNILDYTHMKFTENDSKVGFPNIGYAGKGDPLLEPTTVAIYLDGSETNRSPAILFNPNPKTENPLNPTEICSYAAHERVHHLQNLSGKVVNGKKLYMSKDVGEKQAREFQSLFLEKYSPRGNKGIMGMQDNIDFRKTMGVLAMRPKNEDEKRLDTLDYRNEKCNTIHGELFPIIAISPDIPRTCSLKNPQVPYNDKNIFWKSENSPQIQGG